MKMEGPSIWTLLCTISRESCVLMPSQYLPSMDKIKKNRVSDRGVVVKISHVLGNHMHLMSWSFDQEPKIDRQRQPTDYCRCQDYLFRSSELKCEVQ
jgi:hypothetical protein